MLTAKKFPSARQLEQMDCGPTCLQIICQYYGVEYDLQHFRDLCGTAKSGSSMLGMYEAAKLLEMDASGIQIGFEDLDEDLFPCVAYWNQNHFVVLYKIEGGLVYISDPAHGLITYKKAEFLKLWSIDGSNGFLLTLFPKTDFFTKHEQAKIKDKKNALHFFFNAIKEHKKSIYISGLILVLIALLQLSFPIITQRLVDDGIYNKSLSTILILLLAQFLFFIGRTIGEIVNTYLLLKAGNLINLKLISLFLQKLFKLPLSYFDVKRSGDILQRISDHSRIEYFITHGAVSIFIAAINILILGSVMLWYNLYIFLVFLFLTIVYIIWFTHFMKQRALLDYKNFSKLSERQEKNIEIIYGMTEIKLNNAGNKKQAEWAALQKDIFNLNFQSLKLNQYQFTGARIINELKNIGTTFLAAYFVVKGQLTLGEMLALSYIVGQLNSPVSSILDFIQQYQDATLSAKRIQEIHVKSNEGIGLPINEEISYINSDISFDNVSFSYNKLTGTKPTLKNLSFTIPQYKTTAIVGKSGCGKTTLLKVLLKFYDDYTGDVTIGRTNFNVLNHNMWRNMCGTVMQDSYIFNDTITNNICLIGSEIDVDRLKNAIAVTNLNQLLKKLPLGLQTKIGANGLQLSGGEKQRVLLARAIYKTSPYLFLDEATSSLDAITETNIVENLQKVFKDKTVIIIAHRLSTIKNADQVIVMDEGIIVEKGTPQELYNKKMYYYNLVKNQTGVET
jgi:ATP-binding cassette, subfamily B, bacterial